MPAATVTMKVEAEIEQRDFFAEAGSGAMLDYLEKEDQQELVKFVADNLTAEVLDEIGERHARKHFDIGDHE